MPFWQPSAPSNPDGNPTSAARQAQDPAALVSAAQSALTKARRNLLGAGVLLLAAFLLVPWVLDKAPRAWGDDVILNMPKATAPYAKPQGAAAPNAQPVPIDSTAPLKPSQPMQNEAPSDPAAPAKAAP
jgi:hypothetical protein